jgi:D-3-phosphoglycerate dehydrogenase
VDLTDFPNVKTIVTPCTGVDHVDFNYCKVHGIDVIYLDNKQWLHDNVWATAEHTLYLMLSALKCHKTRNNYNRDLRGKMVGIIGYGRIGQQVKKLVTAFGANVFKCEEGQCIETVFRKSDIVTVHVPLTDETRGLISEETVKEFIQNGGIFINVSRQQIVEGFEGDIELALYRGGKITTNHMAGYTLECRQKTDKYVLDKLRIKLYGFTFEFDGL